MAQLKLNITIFLFFTSSFFSFSQNQILADSLLQSIKDISEDTIRIRKIIHFANDSYLNNPELANIFTNVALEQSIKANYQLGIADAYNLYGIMDSDQSNYESAKDYFYKALEIYHLINNNLGIVNVFNNLGLIYSDLGQYVNALDCYIKALKVLETYDNKKLLSLIYSNLGKLYLEVQDNDKAMEYLNQAKDLCIETNDDQSLTYVYSMLGSIFSKNKNLDKALSYYNLTMEMAKKLKNMIMVASAYCNIGNIYFSQQKFDLALDNYKKSLIVSEKLNNTTNIIRTSNNLGYFYYYIKEYAKAENILKKSLSQSKEVGFQEGIKNSALHLSYVYNDLENYKLAYEYRVLYEQTSDSMYSNETFQSISELFTKLEQERLEYEYQLNLQKKKINNLIILLLSLAFLALFAGLFLIQRRIARRAIKKQESLNKELTSKAIYLVRKNEIFSKIEHILNENKHRFIKENQQTIQDIINEIKLAQNEEVWKEFEIYFNKVHKDFHKNLHEKYPKLSVNEKRLCSLLKVNMKTKDISLITQQSPHTIDIARSRLRKKLGISNQKISLYEFLGKF